VALPFAVLFLIFHFTTLSVAESYAASVVDECHIRTNVEHCGMFVSDLRAKFNECADLCTKQNGVTFHNEVAREWRRLHNAEPCGLYFSPNFSGGQIKQKDMGGACGTYGRQESYKVLVGRPEGKTSIGGPRRSWENDIKMDLEEARWEGN
jgi:hypothetical protein